MKLISFLFFNCLWNDEREILFQGRKPSSGFWLKTSDSLNIYEISLLSPSRMSHTAILSGEILKDVATGQQYKLNPSKQDLQEG